ncbi:MAG: hypothetical protein QM503_03250 [Bacteroidota bacterium]
MIKNIFNNRLLFSVKTNDPSLLKDEMFGLSWHKVNDKMNEGADPNFISHLVDLIKSVSPNDEIIIRYLNYKKSWSGRGSEIKPISVKNKFGYNASKTNLDNYQGCLNTV